MRTIQVKYIPPTDTKGSRVKAWSYGGLSLTKPYDHAFNSDRNAKDAAIELAIKFKFPSEVKAYGMLPCGDYVFIMEEA